MGDKAQVVLDQPGFGLFVAALHFLQTFPLFARTQGSGERPGVRDVKNKKDQPGNSQPGKRIQHCGSSSPRFRSVPTVYAGGTRLLQVRGKGFAGRYGLSVTATACRPRAAYRFSTRSFGYGTIPLDS